MRNEIPLLWDWGWSVGVEPPRQTHLQPQSHKSVKPMGIFLPLESLREPPPIRTAAYPPLRPETFAHPAFGLSAALRSPREQGCARRARPERLLLRRARM